MEISINKKKIEVADGCSIAEALRQQNRPVTGIAVALNGQVVKADLIEVTRLKHGDSLMVIKAFYGG